MKKKSAAAVLALLVALGLCAAAPAAFAGTYNGSPNGTNGYGISGYNWGNSGQVVVQLTGNARDGRCVVVRSWNAGNPTVRQFVGDTVTGSLLGNSVYETHTVDLVPCNNAYATPYHRLIIPAGSGANYWQY